MAKFSQFGRKTRHVPNPACRCHLNKAKSFVRGDQFCSGCDCFIVEKVLFYQFNKDIYSYTDSVVVCAFDTLAFSGVLPNLVQILLTLI